MCMPGFSTRGIGAVEIAGIVSATAVVLGLGALTTYLHTHIQCIRNHHTAEVLIGDLKAFKIIKV